MESDSHLYNTGNLGESGFVLVLSLVILLMLSLFGAWALRTSTSEIDVAGGMQQHERLFNVAEGAANAEGGRLGFNLRDFYQLTDPTKFNLLLTPTTELEFDPQGNIATPFVTPNSIKEGIANFDTWPSDNLLESANGGDDEFDYRYLVKYLHSDTPPMGYDTNSFSGYKFRIQGNTGNIPLFVELGGTKVGVKASL